MNRTKIEYLDFTWNPLVGCNGVDCTVREHCWARDSAKRQKHRCQLCYAFVPHLHAERLLEPRLRKKPARIGACFMGDFFDKDVLRGTQLAILKAIDVAPWHTFLILTKQPQNAPSFDLMLMPDNLGIGVTVNKRHDLWRIDELRHIPSKMHFASFEPLYEDMGDIDLRGLDWIIIGAQTRPRLLPEVEWVYSLSHHASEYNIPVFWKNNLEVYGKRQEFPK